jgi:hypothetical protein
MSWKRSSEPMNPSTTEPHDDKRAVSIARQGVVDQVQGRANFVHQCRKDGIHASMAPITFEQLIKPDQRSASFGPLVPPEQRLQMAQESLSHFDLVDSAGAQTSQSFERLRTLFTYGLLCYELFTVVDDLSFLLLEQALGERFVEYYGGRVPMIHKDGPTDEIAVHSFQEVYDALNAGASHRKGWKLRVGTGTEMNFRGSLDELLTWARKVGLLKGQRSRIMERLFVKMRHRVAHPRGYHLLMPNQAALAISDVSAFINQLWGAPRPGNRLYDGPVERLPIAIGWLDGSLTWTAAETLASHPDTRDFTFIIVQGCGRDDGPYWGVSSFDAQVEATSFPADLLWGPCSWSDAIAWVEDQQPEPDQVEYLDRLFMVRVRGNQADMPRRPEVAAGLDDDPNSKWYLVRADFPVDAFVHVRNIAWSAGDAPCADLGECSVCAAATLASGELAAVVEVARSEGIDTTPVTPQDVRVPSRWPTQAT